MITKILIIILTLLWVSTVQATTYYASNAGSGTTCSTESPCTPNYTAGTKATAGDTVILKNGTYTGADYMLTTFKSGSVGLPITVQAETDGSVIIDAQNVSGRIALRISSKAYITITGIQFRHGNDSSGRTALVDTSTNIILQRLSIHNEANATGFQDMHIYGSPATSYSESVIMEDCVFDGNWGMVNLLGSNYVIIRRCYFRGGYAGVYAYHTDNCIFENNIATISSSYVGDIYAGMTNQTNSADSGDNNKWLGNVTLGNATGTTNYEGFGIQVRSPYYQTTGNQFTDNVSINNQYYGGRFEGDDSLTVQNNTIIWDNADASFTGLRFQTFTGTTPPTITATMKNNSILGNSNGTGAYKGTATVTNTYNNYYNLATARDGLDAGTGEIAVNPVYNTTTYGKGAYLIVPTALIGKGYTGADIGAEVIYRYADGVITGNALWPWPMETRICNETGYSVTYETGYGGCALGGGLWKTLSGVYADIVSPTLPGVITITASVRDYINLDLSWNASTDDVGVVGYNIYRCAGTCTPADPGDYITQVSGTAYSDNNLPPSTTYSYNIKAVDSSGNKSGFYTTKTQATTAAPGGMTYNARQTDVTMTTDANCEEYADAETITLGNMKIRYMWDSMAFYGCGYVTDSQINNFITAHDGNLWTEDVLEMFFDTDNNQGASMTSADYKLYLSATGIKAEEDYVNMANWNPTWTTATKYSGTLNSNTDTDTMYIIEFKITWADWGLSAPTVDTTTWGFDLSENNLNPPNITQTSWNNDTGDGFNDPNGWGTLYFKSNSKTVNAVGSGAALGVGSGAAFVLGR